MANTMFENKLIEDMPVKKVDILNASMELFTLRGVEHSTVEQILERTEKDGSRISRRTFYKYFTSVDDVIQTLVNTLKQLSIQPIYPRMIPDYHNLEPVEKLTNYFDYFFQLFNLEDINISGFNIRFLIDPNFQSIFEIDLQSYNQGLVDFVREIFIELNSSNPDLHSRMLIIFLRGLMIEIESNHRTNHGLLNTAQLEQIRKELKDFFIQLMPTDS